MKAKSISFAQLLIITMVAGAFCVVGSICFAQGRDTTTSTATNPHLRPETATAGQTKVSPKDNTFLVNASTSNAVEVEDGKIGQRAGSAEVKKLAGRMVADHSKANKELIDLAKRKGVALNTSGVTAEIKMASGPEFDRQFLAMLETNHKKAITDFEREAKSGDDSDLRAYANRQLPSLREHLSMVQQVIHKTGSVSR
jgi:putative membrane protein